MASAQPNSQFTVLEDVAAFTPGDAARYTAQMLRSLYKIANHQRQILLACLLEAAADEAESLAAAEVFNQTPSHMGDNRGDQASET